MQMGSSSDHGGDGAPSDELLEAHHQAWSVGLNYMPSMAIRCALQLGIPDIISRHDAPVTLPELVAQLSVPPSKSSHLHRVMQLLVHLGYFAIQKNDQDQEGYTLTSSSKLLVSDSRNHLGLAPLVLYISEPWHQKASYFLADWFRGPHSSAFEIAHGIGAVEYHSKDEETIRSSMEANASNSEVEMRGLLKYLIPKLEGFETMVDVGGSSGAVARIISEAVPHLKCTVFDLPEVISQAKDKDNGNITFLAGDIREFIPSANVFFFKSTMTYFDHEQGVSILRRCRESLQHGEHKGKVIMVEKIANQKKLTFESTKTQLCYDLSVMTFGGSERDETEWEKLFLDAGFTSYKITPGLSILSIIEVFP